MINGERIYQACALSEIPRPVGLRNIYRVQNLGRSIRNNGLRDYAKQSDKVKPDPHADGGLIDIGFIMGPGRGLCEIFIPRRPDRARFRHGFAELAFFIITD